MMGASGGFPIDLILFGMIAAFLRNPSEDSN